MQPGQDLHLLAAPVVEVQVARAQCAVRGRIATGKECERRWEQMVRLYPPSHDD